MILDHLDIFNYKLNYLLCNYLWILTYLFGIKMFAKFYSRGLNCTLYIRLILVVT